MTTRRTVSRLGYPRPLDDAIYEIRCLGVLDCVGIYVYFAFDTGVSESFLKEVLVYEFS